MSFFESTLYFFHTSRLRNLGRALTAIMAEGGVSLSRAREESRAALIVFRGCRGWSVAVGDLGFADFFLQRGRRGAHPRLVDVAQRIGRSCFALVLEGHDETTIFEVDGTGRLRVSGGRDSRRAFRERIARKDFRRPRFHSKAVPKNLRGGLIREAEIERGDVAETLAPGVSPEILLYGPQRLCGRELRPARAIAYAAAGAPDLADPDYDRDDG